MNISHSSVSFHIPNCLSVIGGEKEEQGERERERWSDPVPYFLFFTPLILPISFGLPAFSLFHWDWQLRIIAFIMCGVLSPAPLFLFMSEQKTSGQVSLFVSSVGEINEKNSAVSRLLWQASKSPTLLVQEDPRLFVCRVHPGRKSFTLWRLIRRGSTWSKLYAAINPSFVAPFVYVITCDTEKKSTVSSVRDLRVHNS